MGQILFWLEASLASVLLVALDTAWMQRVKAWWKWLVIWVPLGFLTTVFWVLMIGGLVTMSVLCGAGGLPLIGGIAGGAISLAGAIVVRIKGRRKTADDPPRRAAADWPVGKLAAAAAVAVLLAGMTFWNLDLAVRQEMAVVRAEACMTAMALTPPRLPDSQNAAVLYRKAWDLLGKEKDLAQTWLDLPAEKFNASDEKLQAFLARHADARDLLHKAGRMPGCDFGTQFNPPDYHVRLPEFGPFRDAGKFLRLSVRANARSGRPVEAARDVSALFALAGHHATAPMLISALMATWQHQQSFEALQELLEAGPLTAEAIDALRIDPAMSFGQAFQNALGMEECFGLVAFSSGSLQDELAFNEPPIAFAFMQSPLYRVFLWQGDVNVFRQCMDFQRRLAGQPYHQAAGDWQRLAAGQLFNTRRIGILLAPPLSGPASGAAAADARHQLSLLALASCRWRAAHGAWPQTLAALVPGHLPAVPADPFTGKDLRMTRDSSGRLVLYSVGPDLLDDGGAAFDARSKNGDVRLILGR